MLPPGLQSPREVTQYYDALYRERLETGAKLPFVYPWAGAGALVVFGYFLVDHRRSPILERLRFPLFVVLLAFQGWCIATNQAKHPAAAFGMGLLSAWGVVWIAAIMVFNDCQTDFRRIDRHLGRLQWAEYPDTFTERLDWVADVFCNFRGVGWNWQTSGIPSQDTVSRTGIRRFGDRRALVRHTLVDLAIGYIILDIVKTLMNRDAYFWGYTDAAAPDYLPLVVQDSSALVRSYRLLLSLAGLYFCLGTIFKLGPLFFCGLLGPRWIGVRGEAWMNPPDVFGSFRNVLDRGLGGWWAGWWHQIFRFGFEAPTVKLLRTLKIDKRSTTGRFVLLFVAFLLSGCIHACGSYTQTGDTRPLAGPMRFFVLQPVGIVLQTYTTPRMPRWTTQLTNVVLVHVWLYFTAPLLMDDFARGGIWLFEPIAISPLRGMGFGARDDGWWCWWNGLVSWRRGQHFWDSGVVV